MIERFWNHDWNDFGGAGWGLTVDEQENEYVVRAEAPGFEPDEFDVQVHGNQLVLRAEHKEEQKHENGGQRYRYGRLHRSIPLPHGAETDNIEARYHHGVLELHVPKGEQAKGKRITVKSS